MNRAAILGTVAAGALALAIPTFAQQQTRVAYPADYAKSFLLYNVVDRFDGKHARFMYIDRKSAEAAKPGQALPDGSVVVMELREVEQDSAGNVVLDEKGRMKPLAGVRAVFVQEKRRGWGAQIPENLRNGDWDYAAFRPDGVLAPAIPNTNGCFSCHLYRKDRDFTFTTFRNVEEGLPK